MVSPMARGVGSILEQLTSTVKSSMLFFCEQDQLSDIIDEIGTPYDVVRRDGQRALAMDGVE